MKIILPRSKPYLGKHPPQCRLVSIVGPIRRHPKCRRSCAALSPLHRDRCPSGLRRARKAHERHICGSWVARNAGPEGSQFRDNNLPCYIPGMHEIPLPRKLAKTCAQWPRPTGNVGAWWRATRGAPSHAVGGESSEALEFVAASRVAVGNL